MGKRWQRKHGRDTHVTREVPRSRVISRWLGVSFVAVMGTVLVLLAAGVRFGEGYFAYRYSPVRDQRSSRAAWALVIAGLAAAGVWRLALRRRWGSVMLVGSLVAAVGWVWWGPPSPLEQHAFNLRSLSSDGAFVTEAEHVGSLPEYLRTFDQRLERTPAEMGGTRILSNPPGMTALAYGVIHAWPSEVEPLGWLERRLVEKHGVGESGVEIVGDSLKVAMALCLVWALACVAAYFLGRLYFSTAGAAVFAIIACFNPMTVHFVPGKDPGQLLTINLMLLGWLAGWEKRNWVWAAGTGVVGVIGVTFGLVHVWVALGLLAATGWEAFVMRRNGGVRRLVINCGAAIGGAMIAVVVAYMALGWNIPMQTLAVVRRFGELQETFVMNRWVWLGIGLPSFLLFTSPGFWALVGLRVRQRWMGLGARLALCTGAAMMFTYLLGVTYELPRLWVAFLPSLTLGLAMDLPLLKGRGAHPRVARVMAVIVVVQVLATATHWTMFDVRESEYRLLTQRFYQ